MSYIGYSDSTDLFVRLLVNEFGSDYQGDSYLIYLENIKGYLNDEINESEFLLFLDNSKFCIFELDYLLKEIDILICNNIDYKQKLNKILLNNIHIESSNNRIISIKGISILFDDFLEVYNDNIFDYEGFYISIFGIFVNYSQEKFMEFINDIIKYNNLTFDDFYFLINFLKDMVELKHLDKYVKEFVIYCEDYLNIEDDSTEHISILMFLAFKLNKTLIEIINKPDNDFWTKDKRFILVTLKLLNNYCKEYNSVFIERTNDKDKKFIENRDIVYALFKYLTKLPINISDCYVILDVYSRLMFDYIEYSSMEKVTGIVRYLVSPMFDFEYIKEMILSGDDEVVISVLSFCFISKINYVELSCERYSTYGFDSGTFIYLLRLVLSENIDNKRSYISQIVNTPSVLHGLESYNDAIYTYLIWILNELITSKKYGAEVTILLKILRSNENCSSSFQMYQLTKNVIMNISSSSMYIYEGRPFCEIVESDELEIYGDRLIREYFYVRNLVSCDNECDVEDEKNELLSAFLVYFRDMTPFARQNYYKILIDNKYFYVYKFDLLHEIFELNISKKVLKEECDFLMFSAPHVEAVEFGLLLSIELNDGSYDKLYRKLIFNLSCGDIFQELNRRFSFIDEDNILTSHKSCIFAIKWEIHKEMLGKMNYVRQSDDSLSIIGNIAFNCINNYDKKLNTNCFIYIVMLSDYSEMRDIYNGINVTTLKLKSIMELVKQDVDGKIINDEYIYSIFERCIYSYVKSFVSLTQFEILEEICHSLEQKFIKFDKSIEYKDIEFGENTVLDADKSSFKSRYKEVLKFINMILKSSEADEYYENIFINQDINTLVNILSNEKRFYNKVVELFHSYINAMDILSLDAILKKCTKNPFIARIFVKLLAEYPNVLIQTLENSEKLALYKEILKYTI